MEDLNVRKFYRLLKNEWIQLPVLIESSIKQNIKYQANYYNIYFDDKTIIKHLLQLIESFPGFTNPSSFSELNVSLRLLGY